jgi:hypothetical protein
MPGGRSKAGVRGTGKGRMGVSEEVGAAAVI